MIVVVGRRCNGKDFAANIKLLGVVELGFKMFICMYSISCHGVLDLQVLRVSEW